MLKKRVSRYAIVAVAIAGAGSLLGCGSGYHRSAGETDDAYPTAQEKTTGQEIAGEVIQPIHDDTRPAPEGDAMRDTEAWLEELESTRIERIQRAPKRRAGDRVYVALHDLEIGDRLNLETRAGDTLGERFRSELERDRVIVLVSDVDLQMSDRIATANVAAGMSPNRSPVADVSVRSRAYVEDTVGSNDREWDIVVVLEATITSNFLPVEYTVKERGSILGDSGLSRRFAGKVKRVVKEAICPTLPADRNL